MKFCILFSVLKGDLAKVKRHLKTLRAAQQGQNNKFHQDAQVHEL